MSFYLKKYMWLISLVAVVVCSHFLARMVVNFFASQFESYVRPPAVGLGKGDETSPKAVRGLEEYKIIAERNIFDSKAVAGGDKESATGPVDCAANPDAPECKTEVEITGEAVPTGLKIKLISTFSVGDGTDERSSAIISPEGKAGGQDVYVVGDEKQFAPDTKIVKISHDRVEFIHKNRLEYVELEDFAKSFTMNTPPAKEPSGIVKLAEGKDEPETKVEQTGEGKFVIDRAEIDNAIANLDQLYTQIRAVPHFKEGRPNGLKLLSVRTGSLFSKLGLRRGDVLMKINGVELDIKRGLEIFNQLKSENHISMDVERRGAVQTLEYDIR